MSGAAHRAGALVLFAALALAGCAGVPLGTMARLAAKGPDYFVDAKPAEMRVALDVDARMKSAAIKAPVLKVVLKTEGGEPGSGIVRDIPLVRDAADATLLRLPPPQAGHVWLVYGLDAAGARQMSEIQQRLRDLRAAKQKGSLGVGVEVDGLAEAFPQFATTELATWMQVADRDGFYKLWSGRIADATKKG
jgi:hypothetical protein